MKDQKIKYIDTIYLGIGEIIVAALICGVYLILDALDLYQFSYTVITGAILGGAVTVVNMLILSVAVNRAVEKFIAERGTEEMDEETAQEYAKKNGMAVQNAMTRSYLIRLVLMLAALVLALLSGWFSPLATVIPLIMYRPIIYVTELIKRKRGE